MWRTFTSLPLKIQSRLLNYLSVTSEWLLSHRLHPEPPPHSLRRVIETSTADAMLLHNTRFRRKQISSTWTSCSTHMQREQPVLSHTVGLNTDSGNWNFEKSSSVSISAHTASPRQKTNQSFSQMQSYQGRACVQEFEWNINMLFTDQ